MIDTIAVDFVVKHAHVYFDRFEKHPAIKVFTRDYHVADVLKAAFKGNYYKQGYGLVWALSDTKDLLELVQTIRPFRSPNDKLSKLFKWADKQQEAPLA